MKIRKIEIDSYGPVKNVNWQISSAFTLFYGDNEAGKSLTVEAIVIMLLGEKSKFFNGTVYGSARVDDVPVGYLEIFDERTGKKFNVTPTRPLVKRISKELQAEDFRNIFVIYASDLIVPADALKDERITGLRKKLHSSLERKAVSTLKLTQNRKDINQNEMKAFQDAKKALERLKRIPPETLQELVDLEVKVAQGTQRVQHISERIKALHKSRQAARLLEAMKNIEEMELISQQGKELQHLSREVLNRWREIKTRKDREKLEEKNLTEEINSLERERSALRNQLDSISSQRAFLGEKGHRLKLLSQELKEALLKASERTKETFVIAAAACVFFSLAGFSATLADLPGWLSGLSFFLSAASLVAAMGYALRKKRAQNRVETILMDLRQEGISSTSAESALVEITEILEKAEQLKIEEAKISERLSRVEEDINAKRYKRKALQQTIEELTHEEESIKRESKVKSPEDYEEAIQKLEELRTRYKELKARVSDILREVLPEEGDVTLNDLESLKERIGFELEHLGVKDVTTVEKASKEIKKLEEELAHLQESLKRYSQELTAKMQLLKDEKLIMHLSRAGLFDPHRQEITPSTIEDLRYRVEKFIKEKEEDFHIRTTVYQIIRECIEEEEMKLEEMFDTASISQYFSQITGGRYQGVSFDPREKKVFVIDSDGNTFEAETLSSGTFDQLYLSVRLALAQMLLEGKKGFFIFDDPFIRADKTRLNNQLKLLLKLSQEGWQILYFSAKHEVVETLKDHIEKGEVALYHLD